MAKHIQFVIGRLQGQSTATVQSVLFDKKESTEAQARTWLKDHDFKASKLDETDDKLRFRQRDPSDFESGSFRTIDAGKRTNAELMADKISFAEDLFGLDGVEIFRVGTWNGDTYTAKDLDAMVDAFDKIGFRPPLKLGHKEESDAPAFGWVRSIRRVGEKLIADFMDLPKTIFDAIKQRRFDTVSIEAYWNLKRNKQTFPRVLKAVSLLGSTIPAVSGLKPLRDSFSNLMADVHVYQLSTEDLSMGTKTEDERKAELKKLSDENAALKTKLDKVKQWMDKAKAAEDNDEQVKALEAELEKRDKRISAIETERLAERATAILAKLRVPAYREFVGPLLADAMASTRTVKFGEGDKAKDLSMQELVEALIAKLNSDTEHLFTEVTKGSGFARDDGPQEENPGAEVDKRTKAYMRDQKEKDYAVAMRTILDDDPELKKQYAEFTAGDN